VYTPLLIALQLLTRLPVGLPGPPSAQESGRSLLYYPVVGLLIGGLLWGLGHLLQSSPPELAAALILLVWVMLTGALHLDGLADCADAWLGGHGDRERTLAILKDPASGPAGVVALTLLLLLKWSALLALFDTGVWLLWAALAGRLGLVWLFLTTPYVRVGGLGAQLVAALPRRAAWVVAWAGLVVLLVGAGPGVVLACALMFYLLRHLLLQRLGGTTGDGAGALVELLEAAVLVAAAL